MNRKKSTKDPSLTNAVCIRLIGLVRHSTGTFISSQPDVLAGPPSESTGWESAGPSTRGRRCWPRRLRSRLSLFPLPAVLFPRPEWQRKPESAASRRPRHVLRLLSESRRSRGSADICTTACTVHVQSATVKPNSQRRSLIRRVSSGFALLFG